MLRKNKEPKEEQRMPTREEYLQFRPIKNPNLEWSENDEGIVEIQVPKFKSNFGNSFLNVIKKDKTFSAKMDKIGTIVWKESDGLKTLEDILKILEKEFPDQKDLCDRLIVFIQQMTNLEYMSYLD